MRLTPALSAGSRHTCLGLSIALLVSGFALTLSARTPAGAEPGLQAAAPPTRVFNMGAGLIQNTIKPDKTADFEMVMGKVKEALLKSEDPIRKQQALGWRIYKASEPGPNGSVLYIFLIDPSVKDADYTIAKILSEGFPTEVAALYKTFSESYAGGQLPINLAPVLDMSK